MIFSGENLALVRFLPIFTHNGLLHGNLTTLLCLLSIESTPLWDTACLSNSLGGPIVTIITYLLLMQVCANINVVIMSLVSLHIFQVW